MIDALWLTFALPLWFFSMIFEQNAGPLNLIAIFSFSCFIYSLFFVVKYRQIQFYDFFYSFLASHIFVAFAGLFRGGIFANYSIYIGILFIIIQILLLIYFIHKFKEYRGNAIVFSISAFSYALHATFIAMMALSNTWL